MSEAAANTLSVDGAGSAGRLARAGTPSDGQRETEQDVHEPGVPFPIMTSVDLMTANTDSPTWSRSRSAELRVMMATSSWSPMPMRTSAISPSTREADDAAGELVPGAQVEAGRVRRGSAAERGLEVALVEQPFPPDSATGKLARASQGLNPLDVQVEIGGGLLGTQEIPYYPYST